MITGSSAPYVNAQITSIPYPAADPAVPASAPEMSVSMAGTGQTQDLSDMLNWGSDFPGLATDVQNPLGVPVATSAEVGEMADLDMSGFTMDDMMWNMEDVDFSNLQ